MQSMVPSVIVTVNMICVQLFASVTSSSFRLRQQPIQSPPLFTLPTTSHFLQPSVQLVQYLFLLYISLSLYLYKYFICIIYVANICLRRSIVQEQQLKYNFFLIGAARAGECHRVFFSPRGIVLLPQSGHMGRGTGTSAGSGATIISTGTFRWRSSGAGGVLQRCVKPCGGGEEHITIWSAKKKTTEPRQSPTESVPF